MTEAITIGPHRLLAGDITDGAVARLMGDELADIIYTDPPWGPGMLQTFATMNDRGSSPARPWSGFLEAFATVCARHRAPAAHVFVEMGMRWADELAAAMSASGLPEVRRWTCFYGNPKRPNVLWYSGPGVDCDPEGMSGVAMTRHVLASVAKPGALVFDPCCGKGMTARCAVRLGMRFAGAELNPKRVEVTSQWLQRFTASQTR